MKSERPKRPARAILTGASLFVASQIALGLAVSAGWLHVHDPVYERRATMLLGRPAFRPADTDSPAHRPIGVMTLGSSRTMFGINTARLSRNLSEELGRPVEVFNFGVPAAGPMTLNLYLRRLLRDGVRPDYVVIELFPPMVDEGVEASWLHESRLRDGPHPLVDAWYERYRRLVRSAGPAEWLAPCLAHRSPLLAEFAPTWVTLAERLGSTPPPDDHGWIACPVTEVTTEGFARGSTVVWEQFGQHLGSVPAGLSEADAATRDALEVAKTLGVRPVILVMPETTTFRGWYPAAAAVALTAWLAELASDTGTPVIDARDWIDDHAFCDPHHLTVLGANRFSDRFGREVLLPMMDREFAVNEERNRR